MKGLVSIKEFLQFHHDGQESYESPFRGHEMRKRLFIMTVECRMLLKYPASIQVLQTARNELFSATHVWNYQLSVRG